jgi:DNA-binding transcriptional ArsR family regulator
MQEKSTKEKILQEFFDFPRKDFQMREISRRTKISQPSISNHLKKLVKENLILKEKKSLYPTYRANRENELFKLLKKSHFLVRIKALVENIYDNCLPDTIILYGSCSKGEDIEESDIDLFVLSPEKKLDLKKYEKALNRDISIFFAESFIKLNSELKNNLINGIVLKGYLKVF